jgi:2-keto-myo-inositol isomerase
LKRVVFTAGAKAVAFGGRHPWWRSYEGGCRVKELSRRELLGGIAAAAAGAAIVAELPVETRAQRGSVAAPAKAVSGRPADEPFGYSLNTSTLRGNQLDIVAEIAVAAKAGYHAIEPWTNELDAYVQTGGTLKDLGQRIRDAGLVVENVIAFNSWLSDDAPTRAAGMETIKLNMDKAAQIGATHIATTPSGGGRGARGAGGRAGVGAPPPAAPVSLDNAATYYREALELGRTMGVLPLCELWSSNAVLGPLSHGAYVAIATGDPDASLLLDIVHLYRSGTQFEALRQINGASLHIFHVNDYPQADDPARITDAQRVYPGDGIAPLDTIFRALRDNGFRGYLSLELFNQEYYKKPADENAKMGIDKTRMAVKKALA